MKTISDVSLVEKKGCITFSRICVNLGKVANLETGKEEYSCGHGFPEDCSEYGCPKLMPMSNPEAWRLKRLSKKKLKMLQSF